MDKKPVRVLLIEDDPDDIFLLNAMLSQEDGLASQLKLEYAHCLEEGILQAKKNRVDIIVLDLFLPDARGLESLTRLQSEIADIPVVVLTSQNNPEHAVEVVSKGAQDYLVKGQLSHGLFVRTIFHALERNRIRQEYVALAGELRATNARLEKLVLLDPLTGLLNRRGLQEALSREIERAGRSQEEILALILDLDNFKTINDTLGYAVGDVVLKEIANKLAASVRLADYVTRIGGDEFLILMPETRFAEGSRVAEKVRRALSESPISLSMNENFKVTASLGLTRVTQETVSIDELLARTHLVLRESKKMGKNRVSYDQGNGEFDDKGGGPLANILGALRHQDQYKVLKQPIFRLEDQVKVGYEFLSRFSIAGLEMPDDFFRVCLENNILTLVDHQCFKNCVTAGSALPPELRQHLNIFPSTLIDIPAQHLVQIFEESARPGSYCIEISEQQIIGDPSYLMESVLAFKKCGVSIAIDDVGFGRSSLESLILLEPDVVKIDKKWVNGISKNRWCERSLRRLMKVTDALVTEVVAEGIETEDDMKVLVELGVKYGQGYFLGRPA